MIYKISAFLNSLTHTKLLKTVGNFHTFMCLGIQFLMESGAGNMPELKNMSRRLGEESY